jgi:hypothetical protein
MRKPDDMVEEAGQLRQTRCPRYLCEQARKSRDRRGDNAFGERNDDGGGRERTEGGNGKVGPGVELDGTGQKSHVKERRGDGDV